VPGLHVIPYGEDALRRLAEQVIENHLEALPRLTDVVVLLPNPQASTRFRHLLLEAAASHGHSALLGPHIDTLPHWLSQQSTSDKPVLSEHQRELMLVEALISHQYLYGQGNPWTLADSLLELFDELGATHTHLPESLDAFIEQLGNAYDLSNSSSNDSSNGSPLPDNDKLVGEARLVHTLWRAWHQHMAEAGVIDRHTDHVLKLAASETSQTDKHHFYIAGLTRITTAEAQWLRQRLARNHASVLLQGSRRPRADTEYHPDKVLSTLLQQLNNDAKIPPTDSVYGQCLDAVYSDGDTALRLRATHFAHESPHSPIAPRLNVFAASNAEREAQAIDLQVRLWWQQGKRNIGVVTENRRLARRVRALLERSGIELQDAAGWALSTTSAAATLERWLETVEDDFAHQPFLDLLKSPFLLPDFLLPKKNREELLSCVYRFEQGVVLKENVARDINRYRQQLVYRQNRLPAELAAEYDDIHLLLDIIETAAAPLLALVDNKTIDDKAHPAEHYLTALTASLETLGLNTAFADDAAGQRILEELQQMQVASQNSSLKMRWSEFRTWLGRTLERFNFQPPSQSSQVQLMGLGQSALAQFDALIIASCEAEYLPGTAGGSPFFNDGVRQALGLTSYTQQLSEKFYQFRCLLESADNILLTHRSEQDGEEVVASAWLERLQSFHQLAYNNNLINDELSELVNHSNTQVTFPAQPMPQPVLANPTVSIRSELFPEALSASAYQQLLNCPYQFFAARCLQLQAPESIREMLQKADYGERVHLCLHAFHHDVDALPGPFASPLNNDNKTAAIECLHDISAAVFAHDLEDNFLHRGWLQRWQIMIPGYIDWQLQRQKHWQVKSTETSVSVAHGNTTLRGRLDRLDVGTDTETGAKIVGIIDYKTGVIPNHAEVLSGESVQLPFYALLAEHASNDTVTQVEYLALDDKKINRKTNAPIVKTVGTLETETLDTLTTDIAARLALLVDQINAGAPMPAWGDDITCERCQMSGLCRREAWEFSAEG